MSDDEDSDGGQGRNRIEAMPEHKIRMTDMADNLVEKAIRCKYSPLNLS